MTKKNGITKQQECEIKNKTDYIILFTKYKFSDNSLERNNKNSLLFRFVWGHNPNNIENEDLMS